MHRIRRRAKTSILRDQVKRLLPKLSYISDADEPVQLAQVPLPKIWERLAQGDPCECIPGEQFFEPLILDPYWSRLWRILKQWPSDTRVLKLGNSEQTIFIITDSLVLETEAVET
ncbi:MAG: hypothetical protein NW237_03860 [Cyanobacteriota bacterium]|nr:hypothetical protein [Cyanobacteriota bacterium]